MLLRSQHDLYELCIAKMGLGRQSHLAVYGAIRDHVWPFLKTMGLEYDTSEAVFDLARALMTKGTERRLEDLRLLCPDDDYDGLAHLAHAFSQGACPFLKRLAVRDSTRDSSLLALTQSLEGKAKVVKY